MRGTLKRVKKTLFLQQTSHTKTQTQRETEPKRRGKQKLANEKQERLK